MTLYREIYQEISNWKSSPRREPLVIFGPRQVGKTFTVKSFAQGEYRKIHDVNFWKNEEFRAAFFEGEKKVLDVSSIIRKLELILEDSIDREHDLLMFDEIQDCPAAYEALKFFKEDSPQLDVIATGSYLKLFLEQEKEIQRYPVGTTKDLYLSPLTFSEFLRNASSALFEEYEAIDIEKGKRIDPLVHNKIWRQFRSYLFTGGLPEVVSIYLEFAQDSFLRASTEARKKQQDLVQQYRNDLGKYTRRADVSKMKKVFDNVSVQLNQYQEESVSRFLFREVAGSQGYKAVKSSFDYLAGSGLIIRSYVVSTPIHPLRAESKKEAASKFKVFLFDIGLLHAMLDVPYDVIMKDKMGSYKGYVAENFLAQEFYSKLHRELHSFKKDSRTESAEVEFLLSIGGEIVPVESKSSAKSTQSKSLNVYVDRFSPSKAYKLTPNNLYQGERITSLPLYLAGKLL